MQAAENEIIELAHLAREREDCIVKLTREVHFVEEDYGRKIGDVQREITRFKSVVEERDLSIKGLEWELKKSRQRELMSRQKLEHCVCLFRHSRISKRQFCVFAHGMSRHAIPVSSILGRNPLIPVGNTGTIPFDMRGESADLHGAACDKTKDGSDGCRWLYVNSWS